MGPELDVEHIRSFFSYGLVPIFKCHFVHAIHRAHEPWGQYGGALSRYSINSNHVIHRQSISDPLQYRNFEFPQAAEVFLMVPCRSGREACKIVTLA